MSQEETEERQLGNAIRGSLNDYLRRNAKKQNTKIIILGKTQWEKTPNDSTNSIQI